MKKNPFVLFMHFFIIFFFVSGESCLDTSIFSSFFYVSIKHLLVIYICIINYFRVFDTHIILIFFLALYLNISVFYLNSLILIK